MAQILQFGDCEQKRDEAADAAHVIHAVAVERMAAENRRKWDALAHALRKMDFNEMFDDGDAA